MVYGSIPNIRRLTGKVAIREHAIPLAPDKGDGSTLEFLVPQIGNNLGYFVDKDADQTSTITVADVTVYVDGTPVTVASIDELKGSIILDAAPLSAKRITADVTWSEVSDTMVIDAMNLTSELLDITIRGSNIVSQSHTQIEWGNGELKEYTLDHYGVTSVDTVTIDGTVKTLDTHYWEIVHPRTSYIKSIIFEQAPIKDQENVSIAYTYGYSSYIVTRVSELYAARQLLIDMPSDTKSGRYRRGLSNKGSSNMDIQSELSRLETITRELNELRKFFDKTIKVARTI